MLTFALLLVKNATHVSVRWRVVKCKWQAEFLLGKADIAKTSKLFNNDNRSIPMWCYAIWTTDCGEIITFCFRVALLLG